MKNLPLYDIFLKSWVGPKTNNIWLYSDPHFNDPEMKDIRHNYIPDEEQVKRINSCVGRYDTLVILGDVGDVEYVKKLRGYKVLVLGNHDKGASNYRRKREYIRHSDYCPVCGGKVVYDGRTYDNCGPDYAWCPTCGDTVKPKDDEVIDNHLFDEVYEGTLIIGPKLILSHQPIYPLPQFLYNLHGHDHSNWFTGFRHQNLCAEHINYTPVALTEIVKSGVLADIDSIHRIQIDETVQKKNKKS